MPPIVLTPPPLEGELRLEADIRDDDLLRGLQARIADPLWLLGRQWQVGELRGEDAGSPIRTSVTLQAMPTTVETAKGLPAEVAVEREPVTLGPGRLGLAVDLGLRLKAALLAVGGAAAWTALRAKYPLATPLPADAGSALAARAARSLDAFKLLAGLAAAQALAPAEPRKALLRWVEATRDEWTDVPALTTWRPDQLSYDATTRSVDDGVLQTSRYSGDRLDWYNFAIKTPPPKPALRPKQTAIPTPARFTGMPASRWWEIEDTQVHLLDVEGETTDFIETFVAEFATVYGDDWFIVPVTLYHGGLHRVLKLEVTDVFGVQAALPALARRDGKQRTWRMFELSGDPEPPAEGDLADRPGPWLYLPDALLDTQYGAPIEEVRLLRDEQSNLGWGVERIVEGPDGLPRQRAASPTRPEPRETWAWHAMTDIPRGWIPLLPSRLTANSPEIVLQRARLPGWTSEDGARGTILGTGPTLLIPESEIQGTGITVQRLWQRSRHSDGRAIVWIGRRRWSSASGPGVTLAFDQLER